MKLIRITTLVENTAAGRGTLGEHGLSFWIETGTHRVLFDTGQTPDVLFHNAERLKIDLASTDAIVLSHGHYDHASALADVLKRSNQPKLYLHPTALERRFSRHRDGSIQDVGIPGALTKQTLEGWAKLIWTTEPTQIVPALFVTGQIPRLTDYEDTGGDFHLDETCTRPDSIADDQAIYFDTPEGLVVVLGCAHAGVINTLHHIRSATGQRPVHAVIGGMHLVHASPDRVNETTEALRQFNLRRLAPTHCTGARAAARLWSEFPESWQPCPVGTTFEFEGAPAR
jgi:7,8-dihydropterin-6-yl-methyl-4-(beta-D-ribofuranosyl)aminobenzene 5'-phosphate synthase